MFTPRRARDPTALSPELGHRRHGRGEVSVGTAGRKVTEDPRWGPAVRRRTVTEESTVTRDRAAGVAVAVLAVSNVVGNRMLPTGGYMPWNVTVASVLLQLARRSGCDDADLGLAASGLRSGVRAGAIGAAVAAAAYAVVVGRAPGALQDERATSLPSRQALWHGLVGIPLGTVLTEEIAFRGVLPALLARPDRPAWLPGAAASLLFGLWHVLPSYDLSQANPAFARFGAHSRERAATVAVTATSLAGAGLHLLGRRARHLAAPAAVHLATNVLGFALARRLAAQR